MKKVIKEMMIKSVIVWMTKEKEGKESKLHARAHLMFHRPDAKELLESKLPDYIAQSFQNVASMKLKT